MSNIQNLIAFVHGACQAGSSLVVKALRVELSPGDRIQIQGMMKRRLDGNESTPMTFTITQTAKYGDSVIHIFPPLIPPASPYRLDYATVTGQVANQAAIFIVKPEPQGEEGEA